MLGHLLVILILTLINGIFSMSEISMVSLNDNKVKAKANEGDRKSIILYELLQDSNRFLSTIQIAITLAGFLSSAFASDAFADRFARWIHQLVPSLSAGTIRPIAMIVVTLILSYFTLVLGELVPKKIGMNNPEKVAYSLVGLIYFISKITKPIVSFLSWSTNIVVRLFGIDPNYVNENITEEEIRMMIDVGEEKGTIMESEKTLINNVLNFNNTPVSDIMTHRVEMVAIDIEDDLSLIHQTLFENPYSRVPFYQDSIDNVIGVLFLKDVFVLENPRQISIEQIRNLLRKPYYIPETLECDDLFFDMQKEKVQMAIVIDEYGGTAGLVTMEDLVEEIVGNIFDEYDISEEEEIIETLDGYIVDGSVSLDNVEALLFNELPLDDYDTLSGFMIGLLGRLPQMSDINRTFEYNGYLFTVLEVNHRVISKVKIKRTEEEHEL